MAKAEHFCHACGERLELEKKPGRRDECAKCGAELHCCLNCSLYDPGLTRGCRENQADDVRDKARANFCGWFELRVGRGDRAESETGAAAAFDALFGAAPAEQPANPMAGLLAGRDEPRRPDPLAALFEKTARDDEAERDRAKTDFDALFRK